MLAHKATVGASERFHFPIATSCILSVSDFIQSLVLLSEIEKMIMLAAEINRNTNKKKWREKNPSICFMLFHQNQSKKLRSNVCLLHHEPIPIKFFSFFFFSLSLRSNTKATLSHRQRQIICCCLETTVPPVHNLLLSSFVPSFLLSHHQHLVAVFFRRLSELMMTSNDGNGPKKNVV